MNQPKLNHAGQFKLFARQVTFWKLAVYFSAISLLLVAVFGFMFQVMFLGIMISLFGLAALWDPAYRFLIHLLRVKGLPPHLLEPSAPAFFIACACILAGLVIAWLGYQAMLVLGFCTQNIACALLYITQR